MDGDNAKLWKPRIPDGRQTYIHTTVKYLSESGRSEGGGKPRMPHAFKFLFGGLAGMGATCIVQPMDLIKNRMQIRAGSSVKRKTSLQITREILHREGFCGFYNGLSAGLFRQATYTTGRLGVYTWLFEKVSKDKEKPSFPSMMAIGMIAGASGALIGTPAEVCLIRMTADGYRPPEKRRNYKHVFDALTRIWQEERPFALCRGALPTIGRAVVINAVQLATYSEAKRTLLTTGYFLPNTLILHFWASMMSGLATTTCSLPVDIVKTRLQNMSYKHGKPEYKNSLGVFRYIMKHEGVFAFWKGFTPYFARVGPHTVLTFIFLEQMNNVYFRWKGYNKGSIL